VIRAFLLFAAALAIVAVASTRTSASEGRGTFALSSGEPKIVSELSAVPAQGRLRYAFDIVQRQPSSDVPLRDYAVDYDKRLHLIVISDDFETFLHLHPALDADGHFRGTFSLPRAAHYLAYADSSPRGFGQQVFRFPSTLEIRLGP